MNQQDELLAVYNEDGSPAAPQLRSVVHTPPLKYWHGVANVWLVNRSGQIMASKRALHLVGNPGKWQSYFGGHALHGSSLLQTAVTELAEEAGLVVKPEDLGLIEKGQSGREFYHIYENYAYLFDGQPSDLTFADGEVTEAKRIDPAEFQRLLKANPDGYCNGISESAQASIKEWLGTL